MHVMIPKDDVKLFELYVEAARLRHELARPARTVLYVSDDQQRRRQYPVMTAGEPSPTITTDDGTVLRKVLVVSSYGDGHLNADEMTNRRVA